MHSGTVAGGLAFGHRPRMAYLVRLHRSPTTTLLYAAANRLTSPAIVASDDGVRWSAAWHPTMKGAGTSSGLMDESPVTGRWGAVVGAADMKAASLDEKSKALLKWAQKAVNQNTPAASTGASTQGTDIRTVHSPVVGEIRVDGFRAVERKTSHSFDAISKMLVRAVADCHRAWAWKAEGLVVTFHTSARAMGLAYSPGQGDRRISLAFSMLEKFDIGSVERTTLHELCHHAREEKYPRSLAVGALRGAQVHDAKFCAMLEQVDATVAANPKSCRYFTDVADPAVVTETAKAKGVVFSAAAGTLVVDVRQAARKNHWVWKWEPNQRGRWPSKFVRLSTRELVAFLLQFPSGDRDLVRCVYEGSPVSVHEMIAGIERRSPGFKRMMAPAFGSAPPAVPPAPAPAFAPPPVAPARPQGAMLIVHGTKADAKIAWDSTGASAAFSLTWEPLSAESLVRVIRSQPRGKRRDIRVAYGIGTMPMSDFVTRFTGAARVALEKAFL